MSEKLDAIIEKIRRPIIQGAYAPGSRLPNRSHMVEAYGASSATIQHAIRMLKRDGFVSTRGKNGTFVHPRPPHLFRYGMVYSTYIEQSFFTRNFDHLARVLSAAGEIAFEVYRPVTTSFDKGEYQRLLDDVRAHRLAGIVFITTPEQAFATAPPEACCHSHRLPSPSMLSL